MDSKVYQKLLTVQTRLKAPKNQKNDFGGYKYRNCEDIFEAVKPICAEVGALIVVGDDLQLIGERYYVMATARFIDIETGDCIINTAYAREEEVKKGMDSSQITGSSSSYARKYALGGLLDIDDNKDSDTTNVKLASKEQINRILELNVIVENVLRKFKVKKLEELTENQAETIIAMKEKALAKEQSNEQ